jgi:hypothetical protein
MNRRVQRRLAELEQTRQVVCLTCRWWFGRVRVDDTGTLSRPERCPDCGRVVPITCELHIVGLPLDEP